MSNLENDKCKEAALEDFLDLFDLSRSFHDLVEGCFSVKECFAIKELGVSAFEAAARVFESVWKCDCELLLRDKRTAVEAYIMYRKSMEQLLGLCFGESNEGF